MNFQAQGILFSSKLKPAKSKVSQGGSSCQAAASPLHHDQITGRSNATWIMTSHIWSAKLHQRLLELSHVAATICIAHFSTSKVAINLASKYLMRLCGPCLPVLSGMCTIDLMSRARLHSPLPISSQQSATAELSCCQFVGI
jgi:hypothetical protein